MLLTQFECRDVPDWLNPVWFFASLPSLLFSDYHITGSFAYHALKLPAISELRRPSSPLRLFTKTALCAFSLGVFEKITSLKYFRLTWRTIALRGTTNWHLQYTDTIHRSVWFFILLLPSVGFQIFQCSNVNMPSYYLFVLHFWGRLYQMLKRWISKISKKNSYSSCK
jgi:hypothetical protein